MRFAFYGRISTIEYQDPVSSRAWQMEAASRVVAGRGRIVVEFFDVGVSRSVPWPRRPEAAALLAAACDPDRSFDAVVIGEFERAFAGDEAPVLIALLESFGVQVWLPEARGRIDLGEPEDRALLRMLGHRSEYEVLRNRFRTSAAMAAQVREQGRNLGGRPPYGYRLVDAGPHPKPMHAAWGRRRHRLDIDPVTAPYVRWIFERRRGGMSMAAIARSLNERGVASPGVYDLQRNRHRVGSVWTLRTVAAILENPRYTGRQMWNRQFTDHREAVPGDRRSSRGPARVWNPRTDWVICPELTHAPLVSDDDFLAVQQITALEKPEDGRARRYPFRGLLVCGVCGRRLEGHWVNRRAAYRCRHGRTSAHPRDADGQRWVYWSQARLTEALAGLDVDLAQPGDADGVAALLRARDAVVVCGARTIVIEGAVVDDAGSVEPEQESGTTQLELPLQFPEIRLRGRTSRRKPRAGSRGRRRKSKNPSQDPRHRT